MSVESLKEEVFKKLEEYENNKGKDLIVYKSELESFYDKEFNSFKEKKEKELKVNVDKEYQKIYVSKLSELKNKRLEFFSKIFKDLKENYLNYLLNLKESELKIFYKDILSFISKEDLKDYHIVECRKKDLNLLKEILLELKEDFEFKTNENMNGFLLKNKDDNLYLNFSFDNLVEERINEMYDLLLGALYNF
jgi:vacuolar-type H+-ATPase subunit E/Vma4